MKSKNYSEIKPIMSNTRAATLRCQKLSEGCKKKANIPPYFSRGPRPKAQGTSWATGSCFSYLNLSDLTLISFWTSAPQSRWGPTSLDHEPGCGGFMWAISGSAGWCYISPSSGTCHLQPSYPRGLHNSKQIITPCAFLLPAVTVLYVIPPRRDYVDLFICSTIYFSK